MAEIFPNLGLNGDFGCDGGLQEINENFKKLDALVNASPEIVSSLPASPSEGETVILDSTGQIHVYTGGAWTAYTPQKGWSYIDSTTGNLLYFDGSAWIEKALPDASSLPTIQNIGNIGAGDGVFFQINSGVAEFKTLLASDGIQIDDLTQELEIKNTGVLGYENFGSGEEVVWRKNINGNLDFKTLVAGPGVTIQSSAQEVTISAGGEALPKNWYSDPETLDANNVVTVSANAVVTTEDDTVFYNNEKMYEVTGYESTAFGLKQEVYFEADVQPLIDSGEALDRVYVSFDVEFDYDDIGQGGGFTIIQAYIEQLDSSDASLGGFAVTPLDLSLSQGEKFHFRVRAFVNLDSAATKIKVTLNEQDFGI